MRFRLNSFVCLCREDVEKPKKQDADEKPKQEPGMNSTARCLSCPSGVDKASWMLIKDPYALLPLLDA